MKIIAIANRKGGCGKTTTAINLAACLGKKEQRVLLLDLDPQGHSSLGFGIFDEHARDFYDVLTGEVRIEEIILPGVFPGVDVVPATMTLAAAEHLPVRSDERELQFGRHLAPIRERYDYLVIDCPPSMGLLCLNALVVSDLVLIPVEMSLFGLHGIDKMYETIHRLREHHGRAIPIRVLPTLVDSRTRICRHFLHEMGERFADDVLSVMVQYTVRLKEAVRQGMPIIACDPSSTVAVQYSRLADALMSMLFDGPEPEGVKGPQPPRTAMRRAFEEAQPRSSRHGELKKVVLRFYDFNGKHVQLAGSFNDWTPDQAVITRIEDGVVEKIVMLLPGSYQYRIVVDGVWQEDPSNPEQLANFSGGYNSVLRVEEEHETASV